MYLYIIRMLNADAGADVVCRYVNGAQKYMCVLYRSYDVQPKSEATKSAHVLFRVQLIYGFQAKNIYDYVHKNNNQQQQNHRIHHCKSVTQTGGQQHIDENRHWLKLNCRNEKKENIKHTKKGKYGKFVYLLLMIREITL